MEYAYWTEILRDVVPGRVEKPRISGLTMVIDVGIPISTMRGLLELAADHIDYWKFGFGSASVCPVGRIQDKVSLCQEYNVFAYPGGTSFEIAYVQGVWKEYMQSVWDAGIKVLEVSDGTITLPSRARREVIQHARQRGFTVLTEIGKKLVPSKVSLSEQLHMMKTDLNSGADYVIMEGRASGRGVGVYDAEGNVRESDVDFIIDGLGPLATRVIWEAPLTSQQVYHIRKHGHKANLGNILPRDMVALESLRRGMRSDTMAIQPEIMQLETEAETRETRNGDSEISSQPTLWVDPRNRRKQGRDS